jgi:L-histidine N-alpha-methyltransferase
MPRTTAAYTVSDFAADVRSGLSKKGQKELPSKYLYDEVGSALFEVITLLPEYGLTRTDIQLLQRNVPELLARLPDRVLVAELGSGSGKKTRLLLEGLAARQPVTYYPIDISPAALARCRLELSPVDSVQVIGIEQRYLDGLQQVGAERPANTSLLLLFLGSTIGNFDRPVAGRFLRQVREVLCAGDHLLLSADLEKPLEQVLPAYNDALGITAAFNLNLLARINRELGADFDLNRFQHHAPYNEKERRIEMHLRSSVAQTVRIAGAELTVKFDAGETIWTESSHKFDAAEVMNMGAQAGFHCESQWVDKDWPFAQTLFVAC